MILMSLLSDDVNESRGKNVFLYKTLESVCEHVSNNAPELIVWSEIRILSWIQGWNLQ